MFAWLKKSRKWTTPLHHVEVITADRAFDLIRAGADIHAAAKPGDPTPLSRAQALHDAGKADPGTAAHVVLNPDAARAGDAPTKKRKMKAEL